ncbi:MAG: Na(+)/H(+) antiporter subunit B [Arenicellales bacterium]|nr:Na(+)/H(+) antiporter subunit B [Arenicellales bacterium]
MEHHIVLRVVAKLLIPVILLFALYVQFHGDYGPGGGFQAGVIFGAGLILYALIFGLQTIKKVVTPSFVHYMSGVGLLLYAGVGVISLFKGGNYLDYSFLSADPVHGQHLGILLIELGVGITVAFVMVSLFYAFAGYRQADLKVPPDTGHEATEKARDAVLEREPQ